MEGNILLNCLFVGLGGALGSVLRYLLSLAVVTDKTDFPIATCITNIIGAFVIGFSVVLLSKFMQLNSLSGLFLRVGLCGGFTIFSTFSLENLNLIQSGKVLLAITYIFFTVILCLLAVWCGQKAALYL